MNETPILAFVKAKIGVLILWREMLKKSDSTGPTGPAALETAQNYVPEKTDYSVGSVVIYDGKPYLVVSSPQSGETPDNDPAFAYLEITSDAPASQGATGATNAMKHPLHPQTRSGRAFAQTTKI